MNQLLPALGVLAAVVVSAPAFAQPADGLSSGPAVSEHARVVAGDGSDARAPDMTGTWRTADGMLLVFSERVPGPEDSYSVTFADQSLYATVSDRTLTLRTSPPAPPAPAEVEASDEAGGVFGYLTDMWDRFTSVPADHSRVSAASVPAQPDPVGTYAVSGSGLDMDAVPFQPLVVDGRELGTFGKVDLVAEWGRELAAKGKEGLARRTQRHYESIDRTGVGTHFGDHSSYNGYDSARRREWLKENAKTGTTPPRPRRSSCIGWVLENVGAAYEASGRTERWSEIYRSVTSRGAKGTDLAKELERDGWQAVYWNPDTRKPSDGSAEHTYTARMARKGKPYYKIQTDPSRLVVDYKPSYGSSTRKNTSGYERLANVPFWFGLARGGSHTFVGHGTTLSEFHWSEMPDSKHAIDEKPFEEFGWLSGVIMVPPGTWR